MSPTNDSCSLKRKSCTPFPLVAMRTFRQLLRALNLRARWAFLVLAPVAVLFLASCGNGDPTSTPANTPTTGTGEVIRVEVGLRNYEFVPRLFQFNADDTVEFVLTAIDTVHTFTVPDLGINWVVPSGQTQTHVVTFDQPGEFRLVCTIPQHEVLGMTGTTTVN